MTYHVLKNFQLLLIFYLFSCTTLIFFWFLNQEILKLLPKSMAHSKATNLSFYNSTISDIALHTAFTSGDLNRGQETIALGPNSVATCFVVLSEPIHLSSFR